MTLTDLIRMLREENPHGVLDGDILVAVEGNQGESYHVGTVDYYDGKDGGQPQLTITQGPEITE